MNHLPHGTASVVVGLLVLGACTGDGDASRTGETAAPPTTPDLPLAAPTGDTGTAEDPPPDCCSEPGDYDRTVLIGAVEQAFRIHVPPNLAPGAPLIVQLHGALGSIEKMEAVTGLPALSDDQGFVVVTPQGSPVPFDATRGIWNASDNLEIDHVAALLAVVDRTLELVAGTDAQRVFFAGQSNGGMMSYRMACQASDRIAGVVVNAGFLADRDLTRDPPTETFACTSYQPVSILHVHGLQDPTVPYEGQTGASARPAIEDDNARWRARNGCEEDGSDEEVDGVRRRRWSCAAGTVVELVTIDDHGHPWPGSPPETVTGDQGPLTEKVDGTAELWRFVQERASD
ncbi:MAG: PHB depolymerase family esterase [Myxococcota bacterium]